MARIRTIKPEFWTDEKLSELPEATLILAAALLNYADDEGFFNANISLIKAACSPLREPSVSIHDSLQALANIGYVRLGRAKDNRSYGHIVAFKKHQVINRPSASRIKDLDIEWSDSLNTHGTFSEDSVGEWKGTGNREMEQGKEPAAAGSVSEESVSGGRSRYTKEFERWYANYPLKAGKAKAAAAFGRAMQHISRDKSLDREQSLEWLCSVTATYAASPKGSSGIGAGYPEGWLNGGHYDDDPKTWEHVIVAGKGASPPPKPPPPNQPIPKRIKPVNWSNASAP